MTVGKELGCDGQILSGVVEKMVEGANEVTDVVAELTFILLSESSQQFSQLFDTLDGKASCCPVFGNPRLYLGAFAGS